MHSKLTLASPVYVTLSPAHLHQNNSILMLCHQHVWSIYIYTIVFFLAHPMKERKCQDLIMKRKAQQSSWKMLLNRKRYELQLCQSILLFPAINIRQPVPF